MRILYLMHTDWNWVKQRPHFLAEGLAAKHDLLVMYPRSWRRSTLVRNESAVRRLALPQVPLRRACSSRAATNALHGAAIRVALRRFRPDVVWLTWPGLDARLPRALPPGVRVVYDCMDDATAFEPPDGGPELLAREARLIARADLVLTSSASLATRMSVRGCAPLKLRMIRNAYGGPPLEPPPPQPPPAGPFRLGYIGTIARWIDFDALLAVLSLPAVEVHLWGPCEVAVPRADRLVVHGPIDHARIPEAASSCHAFAVPFRRSPLVDAVDPVKVYEYVNLNRNVVCRRWPEVERHAELVHLYDDAEGLVRIVSTLARDPAIRYGASARRKFLAENAWADRIRSIDAALASLAPTGTATDPGPAPSVAPTGTGAHGLTDR